MKKKSSHKVAANLIPDDKRLLSKRCEHEVQTTPCGWQLNDDMKKRQKYLVTNTQIFSSPMSLLAQKKYRKFLTETAD